MSVLSSLSGHRGQLWRAGHEKLAGAMDFCSAASKAPLLAKLRLTTDVGLLAGDSQLAAATPRL
jgi:hypothetical protein